MTKKIAAAQIDLLERSKSLTSAERQLYDWQI
jgi:hypothetical protein